MYIKYLCK